MVDIDKLLEEAKNKKHCKTKKKDYQILQQIKHYRKLRDQQTYPSEISRYDNYIHLLWWVLGKGT